jgi:hypothetical protein
MTHREWGSKALLDMPVWVPGMLVVHLPYSTHHTEGVVRRSYHCRRWEGRRKLHCAARHGMQVAVSSDRTGRTATCARCRPMDGQTTAARPVNNCCVHRVQRRRC